MLIGAPSRVCKDVITQGVSSDLSRWQVPTLAKLMSIAVHGFQEGWLGLSCDSFQPHSLWV